MADSNTIGGLNSNSTPVYEPAPSRTTNTATLSNGLNATSDVAILSTAAQALLLAQEGLSVVEIAYNLGVSTSVVQGDLGIPITTSQVLAATA